jgi:chemotaxis response regulator CheB
MSALASGLHRSMRVVVVDDSLTIRAMLEEIIAREPGYEVVGVAPDVKTARTLINKFHPDLITLDLMMPGVDGLQFLDEMSIYQHMRVIVVSSLTTADASIGEKLMARGADAWFDKGKIVSQGRAFMKLVAKTMTDRSLRRRATPDADAPTLEQLALADVPQPD